MIPEQIHLYIVSLNGKFPENISAPNRLVPDGHSYFCTGSDWPATGKNTQARSWPASAILDVFYYVNSGILSKYPRFDSKAIGQKKNGSSIHLFRLLPDSTSDSYFHVQEAPSAFFQSPTPSRNHKDSSLNWFTCDVDSHGNWFG